MHAHDDLNLRVLCMFEGIFVFSLTEANSPPPPSSSFFFCQFSLRVFSERKIDLL